jgi:hypothetical protein
VWSTSYTGLTHWHQVSIHAFSLCFWIHCSRSRCATTVHYVWRCTSYASLVRSSNRLHLIGEQAPPIIYLPKSIPNCSYPRFHDPNFSARMNRPARVEQVERS